MFEALEYLGLRFALAASHGDRKNSSFLGFSPFPEGSHLIFGKVDFLRYGPLAPMQGRWQP